MRNLTLAYIEKLLAKGLELSKDAPPRRPQPMPGKSWPTRVAWFIEVARGVQQPTGHLLFREHRRLSYIGKPNRYRALEAHKFLTQIPPGHYVMRMWQVEFDHGGLLAFRQMRIGQHENAKALDAFYAYHPHSPNPEVIGAFVRPLHLKYIGGMRLYSQKRKLASDAVEAYYEWYREHFKRRLRHPKSVPSALVAGEPMEPTQSAPEVNS